MKVVEESPSRLVVEERPIFLAAIMALFTLVAAYGVIKDWRNLEWPVRAILIGFAVGIPVLTRYFVHWVNATFARATGRIEITRRGFLYDKLEVYPLRRLKKARRDISSDSDGVTERVTLVFDEMMLDELEPERKARLLKASARGFRSAKANEAPLTAYFRAVQRQTPSRRQSMIGSRTPDRRFLPNAIDLLNKPGS